MSGTRFIPRRSCRRAPCSGEGVTIGPYAVIGEDVVLGARTSVGDHATVQGPAVFGEDNRIFRTPPSASSRRT